MPHERAGQSPRWLVSCLCGFLVTDLDTIEAAEDTRLWHLGLPSLLGSVSGVQQCEFVGEPARESWPGRTRRCELPKGHHGMHVAIPEETNR